MSGLLELVFNGFPAGDCRKSWGDPLITDAYSYTSVNFTVTGNVYYNWSDTVPDVDNRIYPWLRKYGRGHWDWSAANGGWVKEHPVPPSSNVRWDWVGTDVELQTFDGGDINALGDASGPMWEIDTDFAGRLAMGPGTVGTETLDVGENMGAATITFTAEQLEHTHVFGEFSSGDDDARLLVGTDGTFTSTNSRVCHGETPNPEDANITSGNLRTAINEISATIEATPIIPPVRGAYKIKRTSRVYYKEI